MNECHRRKNKIRQGKWDQNQPQNRQHPPQEGDAPTEIPGGQKRTEEVRKDEKVRHMVSKAKKLPPFDDTVRNNDKEIGLTLSNSFDALIQDVNMEEITVVKGKNKVQEEGNLSLIMSSSVVMWLEITVCL